MIALMKDGAQEKKSDESLMVFLCVELGQGLQTPR